MVNRRLRMQLELMDTNLLVTRLMRLQAEKPNSDEIAAIHKIVTKRREIELRDKKLNNK